ncbi:hypothetical protein [Dyadobacter alkalitolerans]|uniref:hypothetical protein n=1 Tax=Dyadobacter alkalitolerans TaxID=492736 RepID=UPI000417E6D7|nr:hypothetical protein [Dyadobacter alkalitolerans]
MKRITLQFSSLLAALFLFAFSCQDHVTPEPKPEPVAEDAQVKTMEISFSDEVINDLTFRMSFEKIGTRPISEYGVLLSFKSPNSDEFTEVPTLSNQYTSALKFDGAATLGQQSLLRKAVGFDDFENLYFRAYARQANGTVVYGEVLKLRPTRVPALNLTLIKNQNGAVTAKLDVMSLGSFSITEYGVAYSYKTTSNGAVNTEPRVGDKKALYMMPLAVSAHFVNLPIEGGVFEKLYARPYLKLTNGQYYYGGVQNLNGN